MSTLVLRTEAVAILIFAASVLLVATIVFSY
jgi:hypothetical protein